MAEFREGGNVDIQDVEKRPMRGAVGTDMRRIVGKQRMQGVEADEVAAGGGHLIHQRQQIAKVAAAPVALRAQAVKLQAQPPDAPTVGQGLGLKAACSDGVGG